MAIALQHRKSSTESRPILADTHCSGSEAILSILNCLFAQEMSDCFVARVITGTPRKSLRNVSRQPEVNE
jgi:hypothetical protein